MNIPNATAATNTVFIEPMNGSVVIASFGCSQRAGMTFSNPKKLPNKNPKITENTAQVLMIAARSIFL